MGFQGQDRYGGGLGTLWFVYTLCIIKIIVHYVRNSNYQYFLLFLFIVLSVFFNKMGLKYYNSWVNVFLAYPFFLFGMKLSRINFESFTAH